VAGWHPHSYRALFVKTEMVAAAAAAAAAAELAGGNQITRRRPLSWRAFPFTTPARAPAVLTL